MSDRPSREDALYRKQSSPHIEEGEEVSVEVNAGNAQLRPATVPPPPQPGGLTYSPSFMAVRERQALPDHLLQLAYEVHQLKADEALLVAEVAQHKAMNDVYSTTPYTGTVWFLPSVEKQTASSRLSRGGDADELDVLEPTSGAHASVSDTATVSSSSSSTRRHHCPVRYVWNEGLILDVCGYRIRYQILSVLVRIAFIALCWFLVWNAIPHWLVEPGGYVWDPAVLVVVSGVVGVVLCAVIQIPPLVGVLWIAIMWNNIPTLKYLTSGVVKAVTDVFSKAGLTVILLRAGYSLSINGIRPHWLQTLLLCTLPFCIEGVAHSLIANKLFGYDGQYNWAFLEGMLCSVVSPAVVVPGTLYLQELGYGQGNGPLSLMLSAVGPEIVFGVWTANFLIGLIFSDQKLAVSIVLGPVQFIGGAVLGFVCGVLFHFVVEVLKSEARRLPSGRLNPQHFRSTMNLSFFIFAIAGATMVFFGYAYNLAGGGCTMCVVFASTVSHIWLRKGDDDAERLEQKKFMGGWLSFSWDYATMPMLFASMGAKISVTAVFSGSFFPKAVVILVSTTAIRFLVIFLVQLGSGMSWRERLLVCIGYLGKASAQASVGPIAANLVLDRIAALPPGQAPSAELLRMSKFADYVQQMTALYVMFMAPIAAFGLVRGGMLILTKGAPPPPPAQTVPPSRRSSALTIPHSDDGNREDVAERPFSSR